VWIPFLSNDRYQMIEFWILRQNSSTSCSFVDNRSYSTGRFISFSVIISNICIIFILILIILFFLCCILIFDPQYIFYICHLHLLELLLEKCLFCKVITSTIIVSTFNDRSFIMPLIFI